MKECITESAQRLFVYEEKRSKLTLINKNGILSTRIEVDGCLIKDGKRCDYLHQAKDIEWFIELKGQDVDHAAEQIKETITKLGSKDRHINRKAFIITVRNPLSSTDVQNLQKKFRRDFDTRLIVKNSPHVEEY